MEPNNILCPSKLYMLADYTFIDFVRKPIHLSSVSLEHGIGAKLWLKTKSQETRVLADLRESSPKVALDIDIHYGDKLYLEGSPRVVAALVGCMPHLNNSTVYLKDCFIIITARKEISSISK